MKRRYLKIIACLMAVTMVAGCGAKADDTKENVSGDTAESVSKETETKEETTGGGNELDNYSSEEKVTLVIQATQDGVEHGRLCKQELIDGFEAAYPNITVEMNVVPDNQQISLLQTQLTTGEVPDIVGLNWDSTNTYQYDKNFYQLDNEPWVSRLADADGLKLPINGVAEHMYMFAPEIGIEGQGIVYNKAIFEEAGIAELPSNYDELLDACEKVKALGITPFFIPGKDAWTTQVWATAAVGDLMENVDTSLLEGINSGEKTWSDSPEYVEILEQYNNLVKSGYTNENVLADDYNKAQEEFINGNYAMICMGDFFMTAVHQQTDSIDAGIFPIPWRENASISHSMGGGLFIPAKAKNLLEARLFLNYLCQPAQLQTMQDIEPYVPRFSDGPKGELADYQNQEVEYMETNGKCTQLNEYLLVDPSESWKLYQDMLGGDKTAEEVAAEWTDTFNQLMQDNGIEGF